MASLVGRLVRLARTPQGKKLISAAQDAVRDPKNRARLERLTRRRRG